MEWTFVHTKFKKIVSPSIPSQSKISVIHIYCSNGQHLFRNVFPFSKSALQEGKKGVSVPPFVTEACMQWTDSISCVLFTILQVPTCNSQTIYLHSKAK